MFDDWEWNDTTISLTMLIGAVVGVICYLAYSWITGGDKEPKMESPADNRMNAALPPVRLIPFDIFKQLGQMPRCPENRDILVNYEDTIRDESLYIFMSHCWLRGWSGAPGWDGRPHPDNQ